MKVRLCPYHEHNRVRLVGLIKERKESDEGERMDDGQWLHCLVGGRVRGRGGGRGWDFCYSTNTCILPRVGGMDKQIIHEAS